MACIHITDRGNCVKLRQNLRTNVLFIALALMSGCLTPQNADSEPTQCVEIDLSPSDVFVTGMVLDNAGQGVANATIQAERIGDDPATFSTSTDSSGCFVLRVDDGSWNLTARKGSDIGHHETGLLSPPVEKRILIRLGSA